MFDWWKNADDKEKKAFRIGYFMGVGIMIIVFLAINVDKIIMALLNFLFG